MGEFELIKRYFTRATPRAALGVGDDCALLVPRPGMQLAISSDMLVEGRHFFPDVNPRTLGHKALAVNLSDLAACGAQPLAFTLALALPAADESWLEPFSQGLLTLADAHGCELIGGDTTRGPLNICITVFGEVVPGQALLRSGARVGDDIYVSGCLGEARLTLEHLLGHLHLDDATFKRCAARMDSPHPRIALGLALRGIATSAADISDGLLGDLSHILERSGTGATLETTLAGTLLPDPPASLMSTLPFVLAGGDDYELVFTAPPEMRDAVNRAAQESGTPVTRIGVIDAAPGLRLRDASGALVPNTFTSFDHFAP
jgi:thiamine-monophosphate kinase